MKSADNIPTPEENAIVIALCRELDSTEIAAAVIHAAKEYDPNKWRALRANLEIFARRRMEGRTGKRGLLSRVRSLFGE